MSDLDSPNPKPEARITNKQAAIAIFGSLAVSIGIFLFVLLLGWLDDRQAGTDTAWPTTAEVEYPKCDDGLRQINGHAPDNYRMDPKVANWVEQLAVRAYGHTSMDCVYFDVYEHYADEARALIAESEKTGLPINIPPTEAVVPPSVEAPR